MKTLLMLLTGMFLSCEAKNQPSMNEMMTQKEDLAELVRKNDVAGIKNALEKGADVNTQDKNKRSLLLLATLGKQLEMAKLLAEKGADVNLQDEIQDSPFLYAGATGQTELVKLFLAKGAPV